jgi:hypothetical protein
MTTKVGSVVFNTPDVLSLIEQNAELMRDIAYLKRELKQYEDRTHSEASIGELDEGCPSGS